MTNEAIIIIAANTRKNESSRFIGKNESSRFISRSSLIVSAPPDDGGSPRLMDAAGSRGVSYKNAIRSYMRSIAWHGVVNLRALKSRQGVPRSLAYFITRPWVLPNTTKGQFCGLELAIHPLPLDWRRTNPGFGSRKARPARYVGQVHASCPKVCPLDTPKLAH
jgi:hypothetical protein